MCLHCIFLCLNCRDAISNETPTRTGLFFLCSFAKTRPLHSYMSPSNYQHYSKSEAPPARSSSFTFLIHSFEYPKPPTGGRAGGREAARSPTLCGGFRASFLPPAVRVAVARVLLEAPAGVKEAHPAGQYSRPPLPPPPRGVWGNESRWRFVQMLEGVFAPRQPRSH